MRWERVVQVETEAQQQQPEVVVGEISEPGKRWGHTCNAIKEGRLLYVFGGYGRDNCQTNQVHVFDTATHTWSQPVIKGNLPTPRDSHSCTAVGDNLFVFGGTDGTKPLNDLHILDTSSHTWISPSIRGDGPRAREGHSAALVGKRLFIFGGCGKSVTDDEDFYNDLYILNTETFVWKCATTVGKPPSPRDSHTCSSWQNKVIVIGGEDEHDYYLSDVHILDADTLMWRELDTSGQFLPPRAGHSTVSFGKNLFVFGGFTDAQNLYNDLHMLDVDTGVWTKVITIGDGPSARFSVAGDCLDPVKKGVLVFIGGCNKSLEALEDLHYLHTGLARESESRPDKLSIRKQLKLKCQEQNQTSFHDRTLGKVGTGADMTQLMPVPFYSQPYRQNIPLSQPQLNPEKKTFVARLLNNISDAYILETVVDGQPLRGVLFSNKPNHHNVDTPISSRKRPASAVGGVISNGDYYRKEKTSRGIRHETIIDHRLADNVHGKETASNEQMEAAAASISNNQARSDVSQLHKVTEKPEQSVVTLNVGNNQTNNTPNSNAEVVEEGSSHRKSDEPSFGTENRRENFSAKSDTMVASSLTQDVMKLTEGQTEATSV